MAYDREATWSSSLVYRAELLAAHPPTSPLPAAGNAPFLSSATPPDATLRGPADDIYAQPAAAVLLPRPPYHGSETHLQRLVGGAREGPG